MSNEIPAAKTNNTLSETLVKTEENVKDNDDLCLTSTSSTENVTEQSSVDNTDDNNEEQTSDMLIETSSNNEGKEENEIFPTCDMQEQITQENLQNESDINNPTHTIFPTYISSNSSQMSSSHFDTVSSVTKDSALISNMTPFSYDDDDDVSSMTESFNPELAAEAYKILQLARSKNGVAVLNKRRMSFQKISYRNLGLVEEEDGSGSKSVEDDEPIVLILQRSTKSNPSENEKQSKYTFEVPEGMLDGMKSGKRNENLEHFNEVPIDTHHLPTVKEEESVLEEEKKSEDDSVVIIMVDDKDQMEELDELDVEQPLIKVNSSSSSSISIGRTKQHDPVLASSDTSVSTHSSHEFNKGNEIHDKRKLRWLGVMLFFITLTLVVVCTLLGLLLPMQEDEKVTPKKEKVAFDEPTTFDSYDTMLSPVYPLLKGNITFSDVGKLASINENGTRVALTGVSISARSNVKGNVVVMDETNEGWRTYIVPTAKKHGVEMAFGDMDAVTSIALSGNGNRLAVSSSYYSFQYEKVISYVQVYSFQDTWVLLGSPLSDIQNDGDGLSLALSFQGDVIAIGASKHSSSMGSNAGSVCVYRYTTDWEPLGECLTGSSGEEMGKSISLDASGSILAVGTWLSNEQAGHVGIYSFDSEWVQFGDIVGEQPGEKLGISTALSADGSRVVIGASHYDSGSVVDIGQSRIYQYSQEKQSWNKLGSFITGSSAGDMLGRTVSISCNGNVISIGSSIASSNKNHNGLVRFYEFDGVDWAERNSTFWGSNDGDYCGEAVSLSNDFAVVGCPGDGGVDNPFGSAYFVQI